MQERLRNPWSTVRLNRRPMVVILAILLPLALVDRAAAQQASAANDLARAKALESTITEVIARAERSVVAVTRSPMRRSNTRITIRGGVARPGNQLGNLPQQTFTQPPHAHGAGVVINDTGLVLTQYLVVKPGEQHHVIDVDGNRFPAEIKAADPHSGLAVLAIQTQGVDATPPKAILVGRAENLRKGQFVVAISNPFAILTDGQPTASWGVVSNLAQKAPLGEALNEKTGRSSLHHYGTLIQTDARLGWNASGGALVTLDGRLIGVTTTTSTIAGHERPAGYAIPINELMRRVISTLMSGKEPEYGLLGLSFDSRTAVSPVTGDRGISVNHTYKGSPSAKAGIKARDLVLKVNGKKTIDPDSLQLAVNSLPPGSDAEVEFERGGTTLRTTVTLGKAYIEGIYATKKPRSWRGILVDYATAVPSDILQEKSQSGLIDPEGCVVVSEVERGSAAAKSGVQPYFYISHVGGKRVSTPQEFYDAVRNAKDTVTVEFTKAPGNDPAASGS